MQNTTSKPGAAARKNGGGPKNANKKKKQPEKSKPNSREAPVASGPRPVAPPPVSGPWGNPKPAAGSAPPPGFAVSAVAPSSSGFSDAHQRLLRHRALFAFRFLVGKAVEVTLASEERYAGVLDCVDPDDFSVVLKSAKRLSANSSAKPFEDGSTVIFKRQQLAHLVADGAVNYTEGVFGSSGVAAAGGFRTDTEISGRQGEHLYGRELEMASSWLDPALDTGALEDAPNGRRHSKNHGKAGWNQFEVNEKLFGVVSSYDENIYTTKLDKTKISTEQSRAAEKLAQEIERQSAAGNFHLQEERGQTMRGSKNGNDLDEEARYSSVDRRATSGGNAYVPPALRNVQHQSGGSKTQGKGSKTPPAAAAATVPPPAPTPAGKGASTPSDSVPVRAPPKPLSFSEAVTGRSAAPMSGSESRPEQTKAASSPQKATTSSQLNGSDLKPDAAAPPSKSKTKVNSPTKKEAKSGKELKTDKKTERSVEGETVTKTESKSSSQSTTTATTTKTSIATSSSESKDETKTAAPAKRALNPNAKEFKLSASAAAFTPSFSMPPAAKGSVSSPYRGGSPGHMPYPHPGMGYPPPMQEEWMMYDGNMDDGSEMGMPPYMQGGYGMPMMYPPMMPQQNMPMVRGQRGYGGYQQQGYNPRGGYYSPNGGYPGGGMSYPGGASMPGGVGPQPPLPREPTPTGDDESSSSPPVDGPPIPPMPDAVPEVESASSCSKTQQDPSTSKNK
ncbi:Ataxin 2-like [Phytophthora boehmeriae]|uniref:Ataxin 2-like n=1 Tax=Phytophthora boehmeriae TaxID=109152 RepID=A0A8T1WZ42_9STRA|nr:Ataxin 2-like [Phytophthora boehmeriae]